VVAANPGVSGRTFNVRSDYSLEAIRLAPVQPAVAIDLDHDPARKIGELVHLEEDGRGNTWAVAEVDRDKLPPGGPLYYSSQDAPPDDAAVLRGIAVTRSPAMACMPPLHLLPIGMADLAEVHTLRLREAEPFLSAALNRARLAIRDRPFGSRRIRVKRPQPEVVRLPGGGYLVDDELVGGQPRSSGGRMVYDDEGRVVGPLRYSTPYPGILSVR
jgi:hypothetical protein